MITMILVGSMILGAIWLFEYISIYLYWAAVGLASSVLLFVMVVFVFPLLHDFLLNL